ncbi:hypothetical protein [Deminuibacter soli]|uniref:Outer membrane protein beta-barrel domain-containing protein n=1 Tax=Deminuibacter soli TaxID=2291815 RepID=A0A3E1NNA7_9BACT|nr:hypothetical protein [Deminuibacter soli]RFM29416.1 hypothetical protein DXN05_00045 [Deminuibacter soli]
MFKHQTGNGHLLVGAGPYIAAGIGGKVRGPGDARFNVKFSNTAGTEAAFYYRPIDAGINILFGYEWTNKWSIRLNADLGVANNNPNNGLGSYHNAGFSIGLGYSLN